jgi:hypothetical protein
MGERSSINHRPVDKMAGQTTVIFADIIRFDKQFHCKKFINNSRLTINIYRRKNHTVIIF